MRLFAILLAATIMAAAIPTAQATMQTQTVYYPGLGLLGTAGSTIWYFSWPTEIPGPGTYDLAVTVSTTTALVGTLTITFTAGTLNGCTAGAVVQGVTLSSVAARVPLTVSGDYCTGDAEMILNVAMTPVARARISFDFSVDEVAREIDELRTDLCRPTGNHGHCSLDIHGGLDLAQDGTWVVDIADDTTDDGALTVPASVVDIGNQTVVVPADINVESEEGMRGFFILAWLVGLFVFLRLAKLLAAGVCTAGIGLTLLFGTAFLPWQLLALAMLPLALWLEALVPERIYQRFFTGNVGTTRRE